jgi:hypothetical protein
MPIRTISSPKLAFLAFFSYLIGPEDPLSNKQLIALTTSVVESNMQVIQSTLAKQLS